MKLFSTPIVLLLLFVLLAMHFASLITKNKISKKINYVNIGLHILMFIPMLNCNFNIEEAVLVYMISVFGYTLMSVLVYKRNVKKAEKISDIQKRFELARGNYGLDKEESL